MGIAKVWGNSMANFGDNFCLSSYYVMEKLATLREEIWPNGTEVQEQLLG
jgi:hypothetical protein